jgi:hypothetical protein
MSDEQEKLESEMEAIHVANERKQAMLKSKLYLLVSAFSVGKEIRLEKDKATVDDMFKELQELAHSAHSSKNFQSAQSAQKNQKPIITSPGDYYG